MARRFHRSSLAIKAQKHLFISGVSQWTWFEFKAIKCINGHQSIMASNNADEITTLSLPPYTQTIKNRKVLAKVEYIGIAIIPHVVTATDF